MRVIVPSRRNPNCVPYIERLFPHAEFCLDTKDRATYKVPLDRILLHPEEVIGGPSVKQWILDTLEDEMLFIVDDDIISAWCVVGTVGRQLEDPADIMQVIENGAEMALGFGTALWGYAKHWDAAKYDPLHPFTLTNYVSGAMGFRGRAYRYETSLLSRGDVDLSLKVLEGDRVVLTDTRFAFVSKRSRKRISGVRTEKSDDADLYYLKHEWGNFLDFRRRGRVIEPILRVHRQQYKAS